MVIAMPPCNPIAKIKAVARVHRQKNGKMSKVGISNSTYSKLRDKKRVDFASKNKIKSVNTRSEKSGSV